LSDGKEIHISSTENREILKYQFW